MFAADLYEVEPDLLTMGKGINSSYLPCGAFDISDRIIEVIHGLSLSGFTHAAHPLALAGADAAIDVYLEDGVAAGVRAMSRYVKARFRDEFVELDVAGDVDDEDLMLALEIVENTSTKERLGAEIEGTSTKERLGAEIMGRITTRNVDRGLTTRGGGSRLAFCPPLTISRDEVDQALDIMLEVLGTLRKD
jgi:adenosylmethionine-8-amino-7-oxononanoate aminotransferase